MIKYKSAEDQRYDQIKGDTMTKTFIGIEIGSSAYTEFKMKSGEFAHTEDGIFLGSVADKGQRDALDKLKRFECNKDRVFDRVVLFEVCL